MNAMSTIEICLLETLKRQAMTIEQLQIQTGLSRSVVANVMRLFLQQNKVQQRGELFELRYHWGDVHPKQLKYEVIDLLTNMTRVSFADASAKLTVHKKWMTPLEYAIYTSHQLEIDKLMNDIRQCPDMAKTKEMKIIVSGHCTYADLIRV